MRRVFLSSVATGLEEHRNAAYKAIEGLDGHHCVRMEDFGARDAASADFCLKAVGSCQLFIGIVGPRYGSCPAGVNISFTELEYEAAVETGVGKLLFVTADDFPVPNNIREDDESHKRFLKFRDRVLNHRMVVRFQSPEQLATMVVQSIHNARPEQQPGPSLCQVYCVPSLVRQEGWTERLGDIQITVYGTPRPAQVDVSLTLTTNITNRINTDKVTDAEISSERHDTRVRGRLQGFNKLVFQNVQLDQLNPESDELLTISGVRAAAAFLGSGNDIQGILEISSRASDTRLLFRGPVVMALIPGSMIFSAVRVPDDVATCLDTDLPKERIRSFTVDFTGSHPTSFKTCEQETAGGVAADQGTVLAVYARIPSGFRLFATTSEVSFGGVHDQGSIGKAILVDSSPSGGRPTPAKAPARLLWSDRIPMLEVYEHVTWEVVNVLPGMAKLRFGFSVVGPEEASKAVVWVAASFAPHYYTASTGIAQPQPFPRGVNLPVPRFWPVPADPGFVKVLVD